MKIGGTSGIVQICHVVEDLDVAVDRWVAVLGAGPFFIRRDLKVPIHYRGNPGFLEIHIAVGQCGSNQIELIQPSSNQPSVYSDMYPGQLPEGGSGFHHVAMFVDDFEGTLSSYQSSGDEISVRGEFNGGAFAFVDTRATIGFFTEIYEDSEAMRGFYKFIADAAAGWDGSDPKRPI